MALPVVISLAGTFHALAAAATSIARAPAPSRRIRSNWVGVAIEPPAICTPYTARLPGACTTVTWFQSTSSSSAIIIGKLVFTPWPTSGLWAVMRMVPLASMITNAENAPGTLAFAPDNRHPSESPPPASTVACSTARRFSFMLQRPV